MRVFIINAANLQQFKWSENWFFGVYYGFINGSNVGQEGIRLWKKRFCFHYLKFEIIEFYLIFGVSIFLHI